MRNLIYKVLFLFHSYYDRGSTKSIAYLSSIMALLLVLFLNVFALVIYSGVKCSFLTFMEGLVRWEKYLIVLGIILPVYFMLGRAFRKEDIINVKMSASMMRKGYILLILYILLSVIVLVYAINVK